MNTGVIIDVREPAEFANGHVETAINIPVSKMRHGTGLDDIPKDAQIITYCRTGNRSGNAKEILTSRGFTNVINGINKETVEAQYQ